MTRRIDPAAEAMLDFFDQVLEKHHPDGYPSLDEEIDHQIEWDSDQASLDYTEEEK